MKKIILILLILSLLFLYGCLEYSLRDNCIDSWSCDQYCSDGVDRDMEINEGVFEKTSDACCCAIRNRSMFKWKT